MATFSSSHCCVLISFPRCRTCHNKSRAKGRIESLPWRIVTSAISASPPMPMTRTLVCALLFMSCFLSKRMDPCDVPSEEAWTSRMTTSWYSSSSNGNGSYAADGLTGLCCLLISCFTFVDLNCLPRALLRNVRRLGDARVAAFLSPPADRFFLP